MSEPAMPATQHVADADTTAFLSRVRQDLDHSCAVLDGHTLSRLNRIRHTAFDAKTARRRSPLLLPFGGLVTAAVLMFSVLLLNDTPQAPLPQVSLPQISLKGLPAAAEQLEDMDLLSASEEVDFYEELEFYQWLADSAI
ncbi:MAG: hypothetical protein LBF16_04685 [Pseudomonadales bacterium]|jgi:hypothetical protein|nr:hypothetical protein [Pseudomonadales bacterium]